MSAGRGGGVERRRERGLMENQRHGLRGDRTDYYVTMEDKCLINKILCMIAQTILIYPTCDLYFTLIKS